MRPAIEVAPQRRLDAPSRRIPLRIAFASIILAAIGCNNSPRTLTAAQRGEVVYRTNCASCHNRDPNLPGALGPPIAGSPYTLVRARVLHGAYPPGYKPKRNTHEMRPLPWLHGHVADITAYLKAAAQDHR